MKSNAENIQKSEVFLEAENLEVTNKIKTIKSLMDAVIGSSIIETTNDVLDCFNRLLNGNCDFVIDLLNQKYPLFKFKVIDSLIKATTSKVDNCRSVPNFVTNLGLYWSNLKSLEGLPKGLKSLEIKYCDGLTSLGGLPDGFQILESFESDFKTFKCLPESLKSLKVENCEGFRNLEGLPDGLESLYIHDQLSSLESLEGIQNCKGLKSLHLEYCDRLISLEGLPGGLENLTFTHFRDTSLEGLPDGLKSLNFEFCSRLISLKELPEELENLYIWLSDFKTLEGLPVGLQSLIVNDCDKLESLEGLPEGLKSLEINERSRKNLDEESLKLLKKFGV